MDAMTEADAQGWRAFFEGYARASQAADPRELAAMYAPSFVVAAPTGSMCFANDARFLDWLREVSTFNKEHGMRSLEVVAVEGLQLSPIHALATVRWGARFEATGERRVEFQIAYLVESAGAGGRILAYVSQADQEAEMRKLGLL